MDLSLIAVLAEQLGTTTGEVIQVYADYKFASALAWSIGGIILMVVGFRLNLDGLESYDRIPAIVGKYSTIASGVLFIIVCMSQLLYPEASAIHQLIKDIRG